MDYQAFGSLFLREQPHPVSGNNPFPILSATIDELVQAEVPVQNLGDSVYQVGDFYWVGAESAKVKKLCIHLDQVGNLTSVRSVGKQPELTGQPPYALDLYLKLADLSPVGVKFASDQVLSDDGFAVWKRIFQTGRNLLIYNNQSGKFVPERIKSQSQLIQYFTEHPDNIKYQFVLADIGEIVNLQGQFAILEWKRLAGYPLTKLFEIKKYK